MAKKIADDDVVDVPEPDFFRLQECLELAEVRFIAQESVLRNRAIAERYVRSSICVTGPGYPSPTGLPSTRTTGTISRVLLVRNISFAYPISSTSKSPSTT